MPATACAAALESQELSLLSVVAVNAAAVADTRARHQESAVLLGAAARLRGAHDRTDRQVVDLTARGEAVLGEKTFAAAYGEGWALDAAAAVTEIEAGCRLRK